jgi:hypothetical protein
MKKILAKNICAEKSLILSKIFFVCFYENDYKFQGTREIWHNASHALEIIRHFPA